MGTTDKRSKRLQRQLLAIQNRKSKIQNRSAAAYRMLGDLYWQVELPALARSHYISGLALMRQDGNQEGEAEILLGLARVDQSLADLNSGIARVETAQAIYQSLGDIQRVQELQTQLVDLKQRI